MSEMSRFTFPEFLTFRSLVWGIMSFQGFRGQVHLEDARLLAHIQHGPDGFVRGMAVPADDDVEVIISLPQAF